MDEFKSYTWAVAIFDEVHLCKNRSSQTTLAAKALKAGRKFGLTGTPVQNNLDEFWSIMDVISPGLFLSDNDFRARFTAPIRTGMRKGASAREIVRSLRNHPLSNVDNLTKSIQYHPNETVIVKSLPKSTTRRKRRGTRWRS